MVIDKLHEIKNNPDDPALDVDKLKVGSGYRLRVGQYRIIYAIFDDEVVVVVCKLTRRTEKTYRDLEGLLDRALRELLK